MLTDDQRDRISVLTTVMQIIVGALAAGVIMFAAVVFFVGGEPSEKPFMAYIAVVFGAACIFISAMFAQVVAAQSRREMLDAMGDEPSADAPDRPDEVAKLVGIFQTRLIVRAAVLEGGAFFNLVAYMIEGHAFSLIAAAVLLFFMLLQFPTTSRVEAWVSRELNDLQQRRTLNE